MVHAKASLFLIQTAGLQLRKGNFDVINFEEATFLRGIPSTFSADENPGAVFERMLEHYRMNLQELLATKPRLESETTAVIRAGEIAMLRSKWTLTGTRTDGSPLLLSGESTEIVRMQTGSREAP